MTAIQEGVIDYDAELEETLTGLYEAWLEPCDKAEQWVAAQISKGYHPGNLATFRNSCEQVRDILEQRSLVHKSRSAFEAASGKDEW